MTTCCSCPRKFKRASRVPHQRTVVNVDGTVALWSNHQPSLMMWGEKAWEQAARSSSHVTQLASRSSTGAWAAAMLHTDMSTFQPNATIKPVLIQHHAHKNVSQHWKRLTFQLFLFISFRFPWFPLLFVFWKVWIRVLLGIGLAAPN